MQIIGLATTPLVLINISEYLRLFAFICGNKFLIAGTREDDTLRYLVLK